VRGGASMEGSITKTIRATETRPDRAGEAAIRRMPVRYSSLVIEGRLGRYRKENRNVSVKGKPRPLDLVWN